MQLKNKAKQTKNNNNNKKKNKRKTTDRKDFKTKGNGG